MKQTFLPKATKYDFLGQVVAKLWISKWKILMPIPKWSCVAGEIQNYAVHH